MKSSIFSVFFMIDSTRCAQDKTIMKVRCQGKQNVALYIDGDDMNMYILCIIHI